MNDQEPPLPTLDAGPGPALPRDEAASRALVAGAIAQWHPSPTGGGGAGGGGPLLGGLSVGVGLLALSVLAFAPLSGRAELPESPAVAEAAAPERVAPRAGVAVVDDPVVVETGAAEPTRRPRQRPSRSSRDLLAAANALRGQRRWEAAEAAYLAVARAHPRSAEAHVADVAAGSLRLDQLGRTQGAIAQFRVALRRGGPLQAEARDGLARAYRRMGDRAREARALEALLRHHPASPFATSARARLASLADDPL